MAELVERNCLLNLIQFDLDVVLRPAVLLSNLIPGLIKFVTAEARHVNWALHKKTAGCTGNKTYVMWGAVFV